MLSKTRATIITLVAAFSFTGAAIVPTASQARSMDCDIYRQYALSSLEMANSSVGWGEFVFAAREYRRASWALSEYSRGGC